jgi:energy-coupling factor transporter ATP-binding protein EcfA2
LAEETDVAPAPRSRLFVPQSLREDAAAFVGREWLLPQIASWLNTSTGKFLVITGEPGVGKSALCAWLAGAGPQPDDLGAQRTLSEIRTSLDAAYFCGQRLEGTSTDPRAFTQRLLKTLARNNPAFARAVLTVKPWGPLVQQDVGNNTGTIIGIQARHIWLTTSSTEAGFSAAIKEPIELMEIEAPHTRVTFLVDGLDEAMGSVTPSIVDLLGMMGDLPANVKILVTFKPERRVRLKLGLPEGTDEINLSGSTFRTANQDDVARYLRARTGTAQETFSPADAARLVRDATEASGGNFQYARHVLDEVERGDIGIDDVGRLPKTLHGLYGSYLDRILPNASRYGGSTEWLEKYQPLLGLLAVAQGPMPVNAMATALGLHPDEVNARIDDIQQIVTVEAGADTPDNARSVRLFHSSMADFLLTQETPDGSNRYHADPIRFHRRLITNYTRRYGGDWLSCDLYGLAHLPEHLRLCVSGSGDNVTAAELYDLLNDENYLAALRTRLRSPILAERAYHSALDLALERENWRVIDLFVRHLVAANEPLLSGLANATLVALHGKDRRQCARVLAALARADDLASRAAAVNAVRSIGLGEIRLFRDLVLEAPTDDLREMLAYAAYLEWIHGNTDLVRELLTTLVEEVRWWHPLRTERIVIFVVETAITIYSNQCHDRQVTEFVAHIWQLMIRKIPVLVRKPRTTDLLVSAAATVTLSRRVANAMLGADIQKPRAFFRSGEDDRELLLRARDLLRPEGDLIERFDDVRTLLHSKIVLLRIQAAIIIGVHALRSFPRIAPFLAEQYPQFTSQARLWHLCGFGALVPTSHDWTEFLAEHTRFMLENDRDLIASRDNGSLDRFNIALLPLGLAAGKAGVPMPVVGAALDRAIREDVDLAVSLVDSLGTVGIYYPSVALDQLRAVAACDDDRLTGALTAALANMGVLHQPAVEILLAETGRERLVGEVRARVDIRRAQQYIDRVGLFNNAVNQIVRHPVMREGLTMTSIQILATSRTRATYQRRYARAVVDLLRRHDYDLLRWAAEEAG